MCSQLLGLTVELGEDRSPISYFGVDRPELESRILSSKQGIVPRGQE
jgi:hypothetical protein